MNPTLKNAARMATPHLVALTRGKRKRMIVGAGKWAARQVVRKQKKAALRLAFSGLGVAAVAVPVGMWVGRKLMERGESARSR